MHLLTIYCPSVRIVTEKIYNSCLLNIENIKIKIFGVQSKPFIVQVDEFVFLLNLQSFIQVTGKRIIVESNFRESVNELSLLRILDYRRTNEASFHLISVKRERASITSDFKSTRNEPTLHLIFSNEERTSVTSWL